MFPNVVKRLWSPVWDITGFSSSDLRAYSHEKMLAETRRGLITMCIAFSVMMLADAWLYFLFFKDTALPTYTCILLSVLGLYIAFMSRSVDDQKAMHLLGMTALIIGGTAFILLAHQTGNFSAMLFVSITMLFMLIPIVPWGLREALTVASLIYVSFTLSTWGDQYLFNRESLWLLQFIMLGAITIALIIVARNTRVCKADLQARFELEKAHQKILTISNKDPLTGAWNRRYYDQVFKENLFKQCDMAKNRFFGFIDLNEFKQLNDISGHAHGDHVLIQLVNAFEHVGASDDEIIRMGGDEFAVCFSSEDVEHFFHQVFEQWLVLCNQDENNAPLSFSAGVVTLANRHTEDINELYQLADKALYRAKRGEAFNFGPLKLCMVA